MNDAVPAKRYTRGERLADAAVHVVGLVFAAVAAPTLVILAAMSGEAARLAAASVYAATLVAMLAFSACYNMAPEARARDWLRRLDHGAIFLKIAGTYTPFAAISLREGGGGPLLLGVWTVAVIGFAVKVAAPRRFEIGSIALYLALGWAIVFVADEAMAVFPPVTLGLMVAGGVLYSVGVLFHLWDALPYQNAIWHLHVFAATACFYAAIALEIL